MRKLTALAVALTFAGITFAQPGPYAQPAPSDGYYGQYPIGGKRYKEWWCSQNWEQCKQMKLADLSAKKECLEKSESYQAYRECEFMRKHGYRLR
jgi:hypothetical protein